MNRQHIIYRIYLWALILLSAATVHAQQQPVNTLSIADATIITGQRTSVPVELTNTTDIVAVQFTVSPSTSDIYIYQDKVTLTERKADHTVQMSQHSDGGYVVMAYSPTNQPFSGSSGSIMELTFETSNWLSPGDSLRLNISKVALVKADGTNVVTSYRSPTFVIGEITDYEVSNVNIASVNGERDLRPGDMVSTSWTVTNNGGLNGSNGWSEQLWLQDAYGYRHHLGTTYYDQPLAAGGIVQRQADFRIPAQPGLDDGVSLDVVLSPTNYNDEPSWAHDNNEAVSATTIDIAKILTFESDTIRIREDGSELIYINAYRSGSNYKEETFSISTSSDSRITWPESVTFYYGQQATTIYANVKANGTLDADSIVNISIEGTGGYNNAKATIIISDDTHPLLSLRAMAEEVNEGTTLNLTASIPQPLASDLTLTVATDEPRHLRVPEQVVIAAGDTAVTFSIEAVQDDLPDIDRPAKIIVSATGYQPAQIYTTIIDDDVPVIELSLAPASVNEDAGPMAVTATLRRTSNTDKPATLRLSDDSDGKLTYSQTTIDFEAGQTEATVHLGPVDNTMVDGQRTYSISAAVWIASCSCNAASTTAGGEVSAQLTVYDNDGPTLSLSANANVVKAGEEAIITITRNTYTDSPLTLTLTTTDPDHVTIPATVVIPAGESSVQLSVPTVDSPTLDSNNPVQITATAEGFNASTVWLTIYTQILADAEIIDVTLSKGQALAGERITANITVRNNGALPLPELTDISLQLTGTSATLATAYLQDSLPAGATTTVVKEITMPSATGSYTLVAMVNASRKTRELSYDNNASKGTPLKVTPPYTTTISTDRQQCLPGESVTISGTIVSNADGVSVSQQDVEVYILNNGYRQTSRLTTDADGRFATTFTPLAGQKGHFIVGASYPGINATEEQTAVDVLGVTDHLTAAPSHQLAIGTPLTASIVLTNPSNVALTGLKASAAINADDVTTAISVPQTIGAGESVTLTYTLTANKASEGNQWMQMPLKVSTAEGASWQQSVYYYSKMPDALLEASVSTINTTMVTGTQRHFPIELTNTGMAATGNITLALPSWMKMATPSATASLAPGESTTVILALTPTDDMHLNVPVTGMIGINCENGNGLQIPYNIEPVSNAQGTLVIDVCDEYTYNTAEAPHVSGATVTVKHPTTGAVIASGTTDASGLYSITLPEGYYAVSVQADKHEQWASNLLVDPDRTTRRTVDISYTAITYRFVVEETRVTDEYRITTKANYETNVPKPVVLMEAPDSIDGDNMAVGDKRLFYITLTNKGLIAALNTTVGVPADSEEWQFELLDYKEPFTLAAQQMVQVPVMVTRKAVNPDSRATAISRYHNTRSRNMVNDMGQSLTGCMEHLTATYEAICGKDMKTNTAARKMAMKMCWISSHTAALLNTFSWSAIFGYTATYGAPTSSPNPEKREYSDKQDEQVEPTGEVSFSICDPCDAAKGEKLVSFFLEQNPVTSKFNDAADKVIDAMEFANELNNAKKTRMVMTQKAFEKFQEYLEEKNKERFFEEAGEWAEKRAGGAGKLVISGVKLLDDLNHACDDINDNENDDSNNERKANALPRTARAQASRSWMQPFEEASALMSELTRLNFDMMLEWYGDTVWLNGDAGQKAEFFALMHEAEYPVEEAMSVKPDDVTREQVTRLMERIGNFINNREADNTISLDKIQQYAEQIEAIEAKAAQRGYSSMSEWFDTTMQQALAEYEDMKGGSVCAQITLQLDQQMVMTRQAFRASLSVYNGHDSDPMTDVRLNLSVTNSKGVTATAHEMDSQAESLTGFVADDNGAWSLAAGATGVSTTLFVPTVHAAPTANEPYTFGGTLTYVDPFTGLEVTRTLAPVTLTVKPSPVLNLTYFMQRDVIADNPLTEAVEPAEDAEFALLIHNTGYGDATDVSITTPQPTIADNEKGLLIDLSLVSAQLAGQDKTLALGGSVQTEIGTVPALSATYAQWMLRSSVLGHFTDYDVQAAHTTSRGNGDLSLLGDVTIHELIRSLNVTDGKGTRKAFLVNDLPDADDLPDALYLSDGTRREVGAMAEVSVERLSDTECMVRATPASAGYAYARVADPTYGLQRLTAIRRQSDGAEIDLRSVWQTYVTMRDGHEPVYEHMLHMALDFAQEGEEAYLLTFTDMPSLQLDITAIEGAPEQDAAASVPLREVSVVFNKEVDPTSFTTGDITLTVGGRKQDVSDIVITSDDNRTFCLDLSHLNTSPAEGLFVLTIQAADIRDAEGYYGNGGRQVSWLYVNATGITGIDALSDSAVVDVYSTGGRLLAKGITVRALKRWPAGVYVIGGKAVKNEK